MLVSHHDDPKTGKTASGTHSEKEIADIVRDIYSEADVSEMEAVAEENESNGDDVVCDELFEIFAALLLAEHHDNNLLNPEGGLEKIVKLEDGVMGRVRIRLIHASRLEIPQSRRLLHGVQAERSSKGDVACRIHLLHEARLFGPRPDASQPCQRLQNLMHDELAGE